MQQVRPRIFNSFNSDRSDHSNLKIGDFIDIFLTEGKMDLTGRTVTGKPQGSGFGSSTDTFIMTK